MPQEHPHGLALVDRRVDEGVICLGSHWPLVAVFPFEAGVVAIDHHGAHLLDEHGHAGTPAIFYHVIDPSDVARPRPWAALAAHDHPVDRITLPWLVAPVGMHGAGERVKPEGIVAYVR